MRRLSKLAAATVVSCCLVSACAVRPSRQAGVNPSFTTIDTIAARLAELELQRIAIEAGTTMQIVSALNVDGQIGTLRERLRALPNHEAGELAVAERVLLALDARESTVKDRLQGLRLMYTDAHPTVRQAIEEETLIGRRRDELRAVVERNRDGTDSR